MTSRRVLWGRLIVPGLLAMGLASGTCLGGSVFDAIAIDDDTGGARGNGAYAVGQGSTARDAQRIAMSNCRAGGNAACTLKLTFRRCGAYASDGSVSGTGLGDGLAQAGAAALAACGRGTCRLVVADCTGTPLQPPR